MITRTTSNHSTKEVILRAVNIVKTFETNNIVTHVLKGIDLEIHSGEFVAIMGKSGAGKSTLLYQLSLLDSPTRGTISFKNHIVSGESEEVKTRFRLEHFGFVFQDYALFPELTAIENIAFPLMMRGMTNDEAYTRGMKVLRDLSLSEQADKLPSRMSGGQQQRVSIARAIAGHPDILFADEPTANLDSVSSDEVMALFLEESKNGRTIVMVTHELEYAQIASRLVTVSDGVVVSDKHHGHSHVV